MNNDFEKGKNPEEVSSNEVINLLRELKEEGVDFEEEDIETTLQGLEPDEVIGYLYFALEQAGVEDPDSLLRDKGILA